MHIAHVLMFFLKHYPTRGWKPIVVHIQYSITTCMTTTTCTVGYLFHYYYYYYYIYLTSTTTTNILLPLLLLLLFTGWIKRILMFTINTFALIHPKINRYICLTLHILLLGTGKQFLLWAEWMEWWMKESEISQSSM